MRLPVYPVWCVELADAPDDLALIEVQARDAEDALAKIGQHIAGTSLVLPAGIAPERITPRGDSLWERNPFRAQLVLIGAQAATDAAIIEHLAGIARAQWRTTPGSREAWDTLDRVVVDACRRLRALQAAADVSKIAS